jgi:hypothetical protein
MKVMRDAQGNTTGTIKSNHGCLGLIGVFFLVAIMFQYWYVTVPVTVLVIAGVVLTRLGNKKLAEDAAHEKDERAS